MYQLLEHMDFVIKSSKSTIKELWICKSYNCSTLSSLQVLCWWGTVIEICQLTITLCIYITSWFFCCSHIFLFWLACYVCEVVNTVEVHACLESHYSIHYLVLKIVEMTSQLCASYVDVHCLREVLLLVCIPRKLHYFVMSRSQYDYWVYLEGKGIVWPLGGPLSVWKWKGTSTLVATDQLFKSHCDTGFELLGSTFVRVRLIQVGWGRNLSVFVN